MPGTLAEVERGRIRVLAAIGCVAVLATNGVARAVELPPGGTFHDDDDSIFEASIEAIAAADITLGCNPPFNDRFCPTASVTRGQMAAFLVRALELGDDGGGDWFVDDDGSIFETDIDKLAAAGITRGCNPPDNTEFCPLQLITRGQMAAMLVRAYGYADPGAGDWFADDDGSIFEADIDRLFIAGVTNGCNPPANTNYCPGDPVTRGQMAAFLQRTEALAPIAAPPPAVPTLVVAASGFSSPVHVASPPGDDRLFVVEKAGRIEIVDDGAVLAEPFLDITDKVLDGGERGLLSMAFHPDYSSNGRFFVYYSSPEIPTSCSGPTSCDHTSVIAEYGVSGDDNLAAPDEKVILEVGQPYSNHNGGQIAFGPDGMLYIGFGDGGSGDDPLDNGQDPSTVLGSMLRIDVDGAAPYAVPADNPAIPGAAPETYAYGLRNPWRFAFDGDLLYIGDVGQGEIEEIDALPLNEAAGANFGWRRFEGSSCTGLGSCSTAGLTFPVTEYDHGDGCSVTGGVVYRGAALPQLTGHYFYADYCESWLRSFRLSGGVAVEATDWTATIGGTGSVVSFGVDGAGNLYLVSLSGTVYRVEAG